MSSRKRKFNLANDRNFKCLIHVQLTDNRHPTRIYKKSSKDFSKKSLNLLIDDGLLGPSAQYVCAVCIAYGSQKLIKHQKEEVDEERPVINQENDDCRSSVSTNVISIDDDEDENVNDSVYVSEKERLFNAIDLVTESLKSTDLMKDE